MLIISSSLEAVKINMMKIAMCIFCTLLNRDSSINLEHAVALHFMYYNFVSIHKTLKTSPAMAAGITEKLWSVNDIVDLIDAKEELQNRKRGKYKKI